jgi:hypothetical protein
MSVLAISNTFGSYGYGSDPVFRFYPRAPRFGAGLLIDVQNQIAALHDFDPINDPVAAVQQVDSLSPSGVAAIWVHSARTLTSFGTLAADIWSYATRTVTAGGITAQQVWEYAARTLSDWAPALTAIAGVKGDTEVLIDRLADQVPSGPVVVVPAPPGGTIPKTVIYGYCVDASGAPKAGVTVYVQLTGLDASMPNVIYDAAPATGTSDANGVFSVAIPRGAGAAYKLWTHAGKPVKLQGVDAESLQVGRLIA